MILAQSDFCKDTPLYVCVFVGPCVFIPRKRLTQAEEASCLLRFLTSRGLQKPLPTTKVENDKQGDVQGP